MSAEVFGSIAELSAAVGRAFGPTPPLVVDQARIDLFAEATGDHQWIHVDPARAASGPYGSTIAHGYLTLSLTAMLTPQLYTVGGTRVAIRYGLNRVRFPAPLRVNTAIVGEAEFAEVTELEGSGAELRVKVLLRPEDSDVPVCVAEQIGRYYW